MNYPVMFNNITPLSSVDHGAWKLRPKDPVQFLRSQNAIPLLVDEFKDAHRFYPIVFSEDQEAVPLALMGLNAGVNAYLGEQGQMPKGIYIPAYIRRYPFILAQTSGGDKDALALCFDGESGVVGPFEEGQPLFDNGEASEATKAILTFCENFEKSGMKTRMFVKEIEALGLLGSGEAAINAANMASPAVYRGFKVVDESKLKALSAETILQLEKSGALSMIHAHLFSLSIITEVFERQAALTKPSDQPPSLKH